MPTVSTAGSPRAVTFNPKHLRASVGIYRQRLVRMCCVLTLDLRDVGELFGVAAVARLLPPQLQEDGDGPLDLCAVIGRRFEHDGVLQRGDQLLSQLILKRFLFRGLH